MKPGLTRAVPMGILGFLAGALFVILLRGLQGLDPLWHPEIGFVVAAFASAATFVWGMGAFDPRMSEHAHDPFHDVQHGDELALIEVVEEPAPTEEEEVVGEPFTLLGATIWQISFWTVVMIVLLGALATLPTGFTLRVSADPLAATEQIGYVNFALPFGGPEVLVSQFTLFVGFVIFTLLSLAVAGGIIGVAFYALSNQVADAKASPSTPFGTDAPVAREEQARQAILRTLFIAARFIVVFLVLYALFYYVLIGLVIPQPEWLLIMLSVVNALLVAILLLYPTRLLRGAGRGAGWLARVLRGLPGFLGNK